jgi:hypothetical protein
VGDSGRVTLQNAAAATGNGTVMNIDGFKAVAVQVSGTFVGTVTFETSVDGTNFVATGVTPAAGGAAVSTATAPGLWNLTPNGVTQLRVRVSAYTSGTITAVGRGSRL